MKEFAQALSSQSGATTPAAVEEAVPIAPEAAAQPQPAAVAEPSLVVSSPDAAVADPQAAIDALLNQVDTDKMLAEVESMDVDSAQSSGSDSSVLDDGVDTDKLMAEMGLTEPTAAASTVVADQPVDDLLAEFTDDNFSDGEKPASNANTAPAAATAAKSAKG